MTTHSPNELARFQSGERALVYARYKQASASDLYFLEDGSAAQVGLRAWVASELECMMPNCANRDLRLVNRHSSVRSARDGFAHHPGAGCNPTPESLFHLQAKAAIARWIQHHRPHLRVDLEVALGGRERVADVLISSSSGQRLAIEVQYSALPVADLESRTASYLAMGIAVQWVFGHSGKQFRARTGTYGPPIVTLNDVHRAVLGAGGSVLWLNPIENLVATPFVSGRLPGLGGQWLLPPPPNDRSAEFQIEAFDGGVLLDPERGFQTRAQLAFDRDRTYYHAAMTQHLDDLAPRLVRGPREVTHLLWETDELKVRRDLLANEAAAREAARKQAALETAAQESAALQKRAEELAKADRSPLKAASPMRSRPAPHRRHPQRHREGLGQCPACGLPVDPILTSGYHLGCEPS